MIELKEDGLFLLRSSQSNAGWPYCFAASGCQVPLQAPCCPRSSTAMLVWLVSHASRLRTAPSAPPRASLLLLKPEQMLSFML